MSPLFLCSRENGAEGGIRTHTGLLPHGPEPCASASFTTSAKSRNNNKETRPQSQDFLITS